jgi:hypothetical protein
MQPQFQADKLKALFSQAPRLFLWQLHGMPNKDFETVTGYAVYYVTIKK